VSVQELYYHHRWYWQKLYFHALHFIILCVLCERNHFFTLEVSSLLLSMVHPFLFSHCLSLQSNFSCHWLSVRSGLVCELSRYTAYFSYRWFRLLHNCTCSGFMHEFITILCSDSNVHYTVQYLSCATFMNLTHYDPKLCGSQRDENKPSLPPKQIFIHSNTSLW